MGLGLKRSPKHSVDDPKACRQHRSSILLADNTAYYAKRQYGPALSILDCECCWTGLWKPLLMLAGLLRLSHREAIVAGLEDTAIKSYAKNPNRAQWRPAAQ
jgi:hypothetical protein